VEVKGVSKAKRAEAIPGPPEQAEEFMAILLWSQTSTCNCPAARYFKKMAKRMISQHITEEAPG